MKAFSFEHSDLTAAQLQSFIAAARAAGIVVVDVPDTLAVVQSAHSMTSAEDFPWMAVQTLTANGDELQLACFPEPVGELIEDAGEKGVLLNRLDAVAPPKTRHSEREIRDMKQFCFKYSTIAAHELKAFIVAAEKADVTIVEVPDSLQMPEYGTAPAERYPWVGLRLNEDGKSYHLKCFPEPAGDTMHNATISGLLHRLISVTAPETLPTDEFSFKHSDLTGPDFRTLIRAIKKAGIVVVDVPSGNRVRGARSVDQFRNPWYVVRKAAEGGYQAECLPGPAGNVVRDATLADLLPRVTNEPNSPLVVVTYTTPADGRKFATYEAAQKHGQFILLIDDLNEAVRGLEGKAEAVVTWCARHKDRFEGLDTCPNALEAHTAFKKAVTDLNLAVDTGYTTADLAVCWVYVNRERLDAI